jgi:hypothetical protein
MRRLNVIVIFSMCLILSCEREMRSDRPLIYDRYVSTLTGYKVEYAYSGRLDSSINFTIDDIHSAFTNGIFPDTILYNPLPAATLRFGDYHFNPQSLLDSLYDEVPILRDSKGEVILYRRIMGDTIKIQRRTDSSFAFEGYFVEFWNREPTYIDVTFGVGIGKFDPTQYLLNSDQDTLWFWNFDIVYKEQN